MTATADPDRPLRKDAQRTRRLVLDAAKELFADRGLGVGFDEIAKRAGVGVGTVYRRFPDRDSLVEALFVEKVDEILATVRAALAVEDPWTSVVQFCEQNIEAMQRDRGLAQVLSGVAFAHDRFAPSRDRIGEVLGELVARAQEAGVLRSDVEAADLALLTNLISRVALDDGTELWRRYLTLSLDAFRPRPDNTELPLPVPTLEMFEQIARRI